MPKVVSVRKEWRTLGLILKGLSLDEVARKAEVSKAYAVERWHRLRSGEYPNLVGPEENAEALREIATTLRGRGKTLEDALAGAKLLRLIATVGIEPDGLSEALAVIVGITAPDHPRKAIGPAVVRLLALEKKLGKTLGAALHEAERKIAAAAEADRRTSRADAALKNIKKTTEAALRDAKATREDLARFGVARDQLKSMGVDLTEAEKAAPFLVACRKLGCDAGKVRDLASLSDRIAAAGLDVKRASRLLAELEDLLKLGYSDDGFSDLASFLRQTGQAPDDALALVRRAVSESKSLEGELKQMRDDVKRERDERERVNAENARLRRESEQLQTETTTRKAELASLEEQLDDAKRELLRIREQGTAESERLAKLVQSADIIEGIQAFVASAKHEISSLETRREALDREIQSLEQEATLIKGMVALMYTKRDEFPPGFAKSLEELASMLRGRVPPGSALARMGFSGDGALLEQAVGMARVDLRTHIVTAVGKLFLTDAIPRELYEEVRKREQAVRKELEAEKRKVADRDYRITILESRMRDHGMRA